MGLMRTENIKEKVLQMIDTGRLLLSNRTRADSNMRYGMGSH